MKIVVLGSSGQVGWELQRALAPLGEVRALGRPAIDLVDPAGLLATLAADSPDVVVNAAAYTAVDKAESEPALADAINRAAVAALAEAAARGGFWLVHYSTDYVFDGTGTGAHAEDDATGPINTYGRTKLAGEEAVRASGCRHLILRTSWVYAARGSNFVRTMLRLGHERDSLRVVSDQVGAPTSAELIADVTAHAIRVALPNPVLSGTYHLSAGGETTWHALARLALAEARRLGAELKLADDAIVPVSTADYPTPARRPANSRLATDKLRTTFGLTLPPWQDGVRRCVAELVDR